MAALSTAGHRSSVGRTTGHTVVKHAFITSWYEKSSAKKHTPNATRIDGYSILSALVRQGRPSYLLIREGLELGRYHTYLEAEQALTEHRFWLEAQRRTTL
jgi:hypothetical protein